MSGFIERFFVCLGVALLQSACATSPAGTEKRTADDPVALSAAEEQGRKTSPARRSPHLVRLDVDSAVRMLERARDDRDALLASKLKFGVDDGLLQYRAIWQLEPGDVFASGEPAGATPDSPTHFAGQSFGQNVRLELPEFAGAPLSLDMTSELRNNWLISGYSESERKGAKLDWSPGAATVNVQWAGAAAAFDASVALMCDLESTIRLPVRKQGGHSEALQVSGRECVIADDTRYGGIDAQTWGVGYVWSRPEQQSEAVLSVIDPAWTHGVEFENLEPSYQLGLSHKRDLGPLSAKAGVSVRQASVWEASAAAASDGDYLSTTETDWAANASLTWQLSDASLSANWAQGVDRLWFTPDIGKQSDRFGLALDLSRWVEALMPDAAPQFAMQWNWSEVRLPGDEITGNNSLTLDVALLF